ncbi:hypothetical protein ACFLQN_04765 [Candidatus Aenigmatarchaeota archaeon]
MLQMILMIVIGLVVIGLVVVFLIWKKQGKISQQTDYRAFFYIGIVWTIIGSFAMFFYEAEFSPLFIIGLVFLAIGAANKNKWNKKIKYTPQQKKLLRLSIVLGVLVLAVGLVAYFLIA